jgi:CCR4-NOT transcription complex subunit 3
LNLDEEEEKFGLVADEADSDGESEVESEGSCSAFVP